MKPTTNYTRLVSILLTCVPCLWADTIHLNTGITVDGTIISSDSERIVLRIGDRENIFKTSEVTKIEKNEKKGGINLEELRATALEREKQMQAQTGLTAQQRLFVSEQLTKMLSDNDQDRIEAKKSLRALAKQADLLRYFEVWLPSMLPRYIPGVLEIFAELNPVRARPIILNQINHPDGLVRATALRLLAELGDTGSIELILRGLLDHEPIVRTSAAYGLGILKVKEATPALLQCLNDPDLRVQRTCRDALTRIWSTPNEFVDFETPADWEMFWMSKASSLGKKPYDLAQLKPLVEPGTRFYDE